MSKRISRKHTRTSCNFLKFIKFSIFLINIIPLLFTGFLFAQCDDEEPSGTFTFSGHLGSGGEEAYHNFPTPTLAAERLHFTIYLSSDSELYGATVFWDLLSETGLQLNYNGAHFHGTETRTMDDRGDATSCANPGQFKIESLYKGFSYTITVNKFNRIGWNQVGTTWESATPIQSGETFCGSINVPLNDCVTDHYFKIQLQPEDSLHVHGIFTASTGYGSAVTLRIYDYEHEYWDLLLNEAAYGTVEDSGSYVNTGETTETFYLRLRASAWDLWKYELHFFNAIYVSSTGDCGDKTPCYSTILAAINAARTGQTILIAQGTYPESISLGTAKTILVKGGYDSTYEQQTANTTLIQAPGQTTIQAPSGSLKFEMLTIKP